MAKVITGAMTVSRRFMHISQMCSKNYVVRRPVRVLYVDTEEKINPAFQNATEPLGVPTAKQIGKPEHLPEVIKKPKENIVPYEKLSKHDAHFTKMMTTLKNRKMRVKSGKILLEGKRLINDAIKAGMQLKSLYFSREEDLADIKIKNPEEVKVGKLLYQTLKLWSGLTTCPGVMAVFKRPSADELHVLSHSTIPVTILCDNIREPGNLGSIIRSAAAAGCANILLTKGCVDPWETKVLRAGSGGHFRIPIVNDIEWSQISNYIPSNSTIFVADNSVDIDEVSFSSDFIHFDDIEERDKEEVEDNTYFTINEHDQPVHIDESFNSKIELEKFEDVPLPCHLYSCIKYPKKNIVLYIGGETCGVDPKVVKLACEFGGRKIKIPMENGMDSLNNAFAMTVILYEIKRQFSSQLYVMK